MKERYLALSVLATGLATAVSAPLGAAVIATLIPLTAVVIGPRVELTRFAQAFVSIGAMLAGVIVARVTALPDDINDGISERTLLFAMPTLLIAAVRAMLRAPAYGARLTVVATLVALTAAGRGIAPAFPFLAGASILFGLLALRANDPGRAEARDLRARHFGGVVFGVTVALGLTAASSFTLPLVRQAVLARLMARFQPQTGFSETMTLGALSGMLQSDTVALRVRGDAPPLLRGLVLTRYVSRQGNWETIDQRFARAVIETEKQPAGDGFVEVERARAGNGPTRVYFSELGATDVVSSSGFLDQDRIGVLRQAGNELAKRIWFRRGEPPTEPEPTAEELVLPPQIAPAMALILAEWGVRDQPPREKLAIIESRLLSDYTYSLDFKRTPGKDTVVDFLREHKEGHCEYFASAFALLARAARIPSRVVTGYRVGERSPFGYTIVRERDAHAWVEVWLEDHWRTYDPTPASDLPSRDVETPWFSALVDGIRTGWEATDDWLEKRTAFEFSVALVMMVGALVLVRAFRNREKKKQVTVVTVPAELALLTTALARVGVPRDANETLGVLSSRIAETDKLDSSRKAAVLAALERYQAWRFGGYGDATEILAEVRAAALGLGSGRPLA
jgi:transglutaminase-like putative cysteine protease